MSLILDFAPYTPFAEPRALRLPGIFSMDPAEWTVVLPDFAAQVTYRGELLANHRDTVLACMPEAEAAAAELYEMLLANLSDRADYTVGPDQVTRPDGATVDLDPDAPLETINRLVAEDFCIMMPCPDGGEYRLKAAILCFPSRWLLAEKLDRPLTVIHDPVPHYDAKIAARVNRLFEGIQPGKPLVRCNWLVHGDSELFRPMGRETTKGVPASREEPIAKGLFLRTERQSMVRLPKSRAVVFGIKTSMCPVECLDPQASYALAEAMGALGQDTLDYSERGEVFAAAMHALTEKAALA